MQKSPFLRREVLAPFLAAIVAVVVLPELTASAASTIYYCPDRKGDQQYSAQPGPGCIPLVDKKAERPEGMSPLMLMLVLSLVPFPVLAIAILADRWLKATQKTVS